MALAAILASLQTRLIDARRDIYDSRWGGHGETVHTDPFSRLYWIHRGEGAVTLEGDRRLYHLRPGYLFVFPAHSRGRYTTPGGMDLAWLHFTAEVLGGLEPFGFLNWPRMVRATDRSRVDARWARLLSLQGGEDGGARLEADGLLRQLLAPFAAESEASDRLAEVARFEPVLAYMEHHLARPLRLDELAGLVHLQPTYFSNRFTKTVGVSPMAYLQRLRVRRAEGLLRSGIDSLEEIARAVGFYDAFHFSKTFKRHTGMAPSRYRAKPTVEQTLPPRS